MVVGRVEVVGRADRERQIRSDVTRSLHGDAGPSAVLKVVANPLRIPAA